MGTAGGTAGGDTKGGTVRGVQRTPPPKGKHHWTGAGWDGDSKGETMGGMDGMHTIRPTVKKISKDPEELLGKELFYRFIELEKNYIWTIS